MGSLKKILAVVVVITMLASFMIPSFAATTTTKTALEKATDLNNMGLYKGTSTTSFVPNLEGSLTREQGIALVVRLMGKDAEAQAVTSAQLATAAAKFSDFATISSDEFKKDVAFGVAEGFILGMGNGTLQPKSNLTGNQFAKMVLVALEYAQDTDFNFANSAVFLAGKAGDDVVEAAKTANTGILRSSAVVMGYGALLATVNGQAIKGIDVLVAAGAVTPAQATAAGLTLTAVPTATPVVTATASADLVTATPTATADVVTAVKVVSTSAINGTTETSLTGSVKVTSNIQVVFDKDLDVATVVSANVYLKQNGIKQLATVTYNAAKKMATIDPTSYLTAAKEYELTVENVKSAEGATAPKYTTKFTTSSNAVVTAALFDSANAEVANNLALATFDADLDGGNLSETGENFVIQFNADMDYNTLNSTNVKMYDVTDSAYIVITALAAGVNGTDKYLWINNTGLVATHKYRLTIKASASDLAGNTLGEDYNATFYCLGTAPTYGTFTPADAATNVYPSITAGSGQSAFRWQVAVTKDLDPKTVVGTNVYMTETISGAVVAATVSYDAGARYIQIIPTANLKEGTGYTVTIKNVKDTDGLGLTDRKDATALTFTTGDFTKPTLVSVTPVNATEGFAITSPVALVFSEKMNDTTFTLGTNVKMLDASNSDAAFANFTSWLKSWSADGKTLSLTPTSDNELLPNRTYKLVLEKDVLADSSTNANKVADKITTAFTTSNTATDVVDKARLSGFTTNDTELLVGALNVDVAKTDTIDFTFTNALKTDTATYILDDLVKVERYVAETGIWKTVSTANDAAANVVGVTLANSNKTIELESPDSWTQDADTAIDETAAGAGLLIQDTQYRITLAGTIKDANDNGIGAKTYTFTTGTKPTVDTTYSYPAKFVQGIPVAAPYIVAMIGDTESKLDQSTLNSTTVTMVKSSDNSAAPYTLAYVKPAKSATVVATAGSAADETGTTNLVVTDSSEFSVGDIITVADTTLMGYCVVAIPGATALTLDRALSTDIAAVSAITKKQGVVYKLNTNGEMSSYTEYQVRVNGVKDVAGNTVDSTTYAFRTVANPATLAVVSQTIANNQTSVPVNAAIEFTFNEEIPVGVVTRDTAILAVAGADGTTAAKVVALQKQTGPAVVPGTIKIDNTNKKVIKVVPYGLLEADTIYNISINGTISSVALGDGKKLGDNVTLSFRTEATASVKPTITTAKFFDLDKDGVTDVGDMLVITYSAGSQALAGVDPNTKFAVTSGTLAVASTATSTDGATTLTITMVGASPANAIVPGVSKIAAKAAFTDATGNAFDTGDVTITAGN